MIKTHAGYNTNNEESVNWSECDLGHMRNLEAYLTGHRTHEYGPKLYVNVHC